MRIPRARTVRRDTLRARPEAHSFEHLEVRFLLSGLATTTDDLKVVAPILPDLIYQIPAGPRLPEPPINFPVDSKLAQDDSYVLNGSNGTPTVHVDLIWPVGPDPSDGHLLVSDASRKILFDLPLDGVDTLDGKLPIPSGQGGTSYLVISLQIDRTGSSSSPGGSYQIAISWEPPPTPVTASHPQLFGPSATGSSGAAGFSSTPGLGQPSSSPTIEDSGELPPPLVPPRPVAPGSTFEGGPAGGQDSSAGPQGSAGLPRGVAVPAGPTTGPASASSVSSPSTGFVGPVPYAGVGLGSPVTTGEGSYRGRQAVLGPLPLSGSTPDGGIFAYPYGQAKGVRNPIRATFTIELKPETTEAPGNTPQGQGVGESGLISADLEMPRLSIARPFELEMEGSPLATGAVFLPPIGALAEARLARASNGSGASRWPVLYSRMKPRTSLVALLLGSAGLFFGLVAPDCVTRLTAWQEERRWKRQASLMKG